MNAREAHRAMLEFLDQFISRGASRSVVAFRDRFAAGPTEYERFTAELRSDAPSELDAFDAMRRVFAHELEVSDMADEPQVGFRDLLSWTERELDGGTSDPAQWDDWLRSVDTARRMPDPTAFTTVIRANMRVRRADEGGRRTGIADGYRGNLAFGSPVADETRRAQHGTLVVFEDATAIEPGQTAVLRAYVMLPTYLPTELGPDTEIQLMEGHRVVAEGKGVERLRDDSGRSPQDLADAKARPLRAAA